MSKQLTKKQQKIINFIRGYIDEYSYPPTYDEIATHFNMKKPSVFDHLNAIERKGYLKKIPKRARTIELFEHLTSTKSITIPILGKIAAGSPLLAVENIEGTLKLDWSLVRNKKSFALRVKGESMIDAGIRDGDLVIISIQPVVEDNEIAAVLVDDEVTLKYYQANADAIRLIPANPKFKPIIIRRGTKDVRIIGKVTGLIRKF